jgi:hypothetical protein
MGRIQRKQAPEPQRTVKQDAYATALESLVAFAYSETAQWPRRLTALDGKLNRLVRGNSLTSMVMLPRLAALSDDDAIVLHVEIRTALERFVDEKYWAMPAALDGVHAIVWRDRAGRVALDYNGAEGWPRGFWITFAQVLLNAGDRLRRCPAQTRKAGVCGQVFVRTGRRLYCSAACAQRERSRTHYAAHRAEIAEARHQAYFSRLKRAHPRAKERRRRRRS